MTKEEAYKMAEKFLIRAYGSDNPEYVTIAMTAIVDKDDWKIVKMLESFIKFENDIIDTLKK